MATQKNPGQKLAARLLLARRKEQDWLAVPDAVLQAALEGRRPLSAVERGALEQSPLTQRRFRHLALRWRALGQAQASTAKVPPGGMPLAGREAANQPWFCGSFGMLRQADSGAALERLPTDDCHWALHFLPRGVAWRVVLALDPGAPFAARMMGERPVLRVLDGAGAQVLRGNLDDDGECEAEWPFPEPPVRHFPQCGGGFSVELA